MNLVEEIKQIATLEILAGVKIAHQQRGIWMTNNVTHHELCDSFINKGWLLETTSCHCDPDSKDRSFQLTLKGLKETDFVQVSDSKEYVCDHDCCSVK
jgi:hypothetical protein